MFINLFQKQSEEKYVLVREPNRPVVDYTLFHLEHLKMKTKMMVMMNNYY